MVKFLQPRVTPLPTDIDLTGKTAVAMGPSSGLGLELARQLLQMRASTVILAVRNVAKGEACAKDLLQDHEVPKLNPKPSIKVMELHIDRYDSVQQFASQLRDEIPVVDLLILNAGISPVTLERSPNGHARAVQVNYLSNVLLIAELLPYLQAGAEKTGSPARISWVGSWMHESLSRLQTSDRHVTKFSTSSLLCLSISTLTANYRDSYCSCSFAGNISSMCFLCLAVR